MSLLLRAMCLIKGQKMIRDVATQIALTERQYGIDTSVEEYLKELKFGLVEVVYEWARGMVGVRHSTYIGWVVIVQFNKLHLSNLY